MSEILAGLEQTGALRLLLYLKEVGQAWRFDLITHMKVSQPAIYNALRNLNRLKLITQIEEDKPPFRKIAELSDKGKKVVEYLTKIQEILLKEH